MELMVVLLVIAVVTAMILPEMRGTLDEAALRAGARRLAGACDAAHARAVATARTQRLRIDPASGRFAVEPDPAAGRSARDGRDAAAAPDVAGTLDPRLVVRVERPPAQESLVLPERPAGAASPGAVAFYADGTADPAEVLLQDRSGFRLALHVNPVTARVRVRDLGRP